MSQDSVIVVLFHCQTQGGRTRSECVQFSSTLSSHAIEFGKAILCYFSWVHFLSTAFEQF